MATPTRRPREIHSADLEVGQLPSVSLNLEDELDPSNIVLPVDSALMADQAEALAFAEQPVMIRIEPGADEDAPMVWDCWVNGKGAECMINGKWIEMSALPIGVPVITKRKYIEVLARSKQTVVKTRVVKHQDREDNIADRRTRQVTPFSVLQDKDPRGGEWLTRLFAEG
jgi:hypothetical protein